jgi:hypothetical protein
MNKIQLNKFQYHPFHLVENSPWPILVSFSLLSLTTGAVMYLQGYPNGGKIYLVCSVCSKYTQHVFLISQTQYFLITL